MKISAKLLAILAAVSILSCNKEEDEAKSSLKDITPNLNIDIDTTITVGESITFENSNVDFITGLNWTFEGGSPATSTAAIPTVTYNTVGTYDVTLVVTDGSRNDTIKAEDLVEVIPVEPVTAAFSSDTAKVGKTGTVAFSSDNNTNVVSWNWQFEGGTPATSTVQNPSVRYDSVGMFDVKLIVSSRNRTDTIETTDFIESIETDTVNIPDINLRTPVLSIHDDNNDGRLSRTEALDITAVGLSNVTDPTGIEEFTNLESISTNSGNTFTTINLSQNNKLEEIELDFLGLTSIQLPTSATNIDHIDLNPNSLSSIDLSGVVGVRALELANNNLSSLDVSMLTNSSLILTTKSNTSLSCIKVSSSQSTLIATWDLDAGTTTSTTSCP